MKTGNGIVDVIATMDIKGNMIHNPWFSNIRLDSGKSDLNAIVLLSEIYYWYTPSEERNEQGFTVGYRKKFKGDLLQKSYEQLGTKFGLTKRQVKDALDRLEARGVIKKHFRNLKTQSGPINNVLYIELVPSVLSELNSMDLQSNEFDVTFKSNPTLHEGDTQLTFDSETNTKITTKTTTKTTNTNNNLPVENVKEETVSKKSKYNYEEFDMKMANLLLTLMKENNPTFNDSRTNLESWANELRLLRTADLKEEKTIEYLLRWCQGHHFWKTNILSTKTFREKWDRLYMQSKEEYERKQKNNTYNSYQQNNQVPRSTYEDYDKFSI